MITPTNRGLLVKGNGHTNISTAWHKEYHVLISHYLRLVGYGNLTDTDYSGNKGINWNRNT